MAGENGKKMKKGKNGKKERKKSQNQFYSTGKTRQHLNYKWLGDIKNETMTNSYNFQPKGSLDYRCDTKIAHNDKNETFCR